VTTNKQNVTRNKQKQWSKALRLSGGEEPFEYEEVLKLGRPLGSKMIDARFKDLLKTRIFQPEEYEKISPQAIDQVSSA
jgi:hypothetical protein